MIRFFDVIFAIFAIIFLSPVFLLIYLFLLTESDVAGVFFKQTRVGHNLDKFKILKFRSMKSDKNRNDGNTDIKDGKKLTLEEMKKLRREFQTTISNDPRITRFGKILRKTSLDELPQLFNVLVGEMSFVGPRPDTPIQEVDYNPTNWKARHDVKPGITGYAQINGRSNSSKEQRISHDLYWVNNVSVKLYFKIIFKTFFLVTKGSN